MDIDSLDWVNVLCWLKLVDLIIWCTGKLHLFEFESRLIKICSNFVFKIGKAFQRQI